jgi:hypothetical protein
MTPASGKRLAHLQRGFALIAILALAALITAFIIASALNRTPTDIVNEREDRSMSALRKAKAALIAYAANEQWQASKGQVSTQPGGLPCPDIDPDTDSSNTGVSAGAICSSNATNRVGRFPFSTIGAEDLRDASGERLWYAVSSTFYKNSANVINSETLGQLNVTGPAAASNVVAIVFAPGEALSGQNRLGAGYNTPAAYLEGFTPSSPDYTFASITRSSGTANDRLLVITQAELMAVVEPVVAARIERDVKPLLADYFSVWGRYPFAVPFVSPSAVQGAYLGASPQTQGLLPVTNTATFAWQNATVTQTGGAAGTVVDSSNCSINSSTLLLSCFVHYTNGFDSNSARPEIRIDVTLSNVNNAFADAPASAPSPWNLNMRDGNNNVPTYQGIPYGYWSAAPSGASLVPTQSFAAGTLTYTGRLQNANSMNNAATITTTLPAPPGLLPRLTNPTGTNPNIVWYLTNQWYRQTYYAVAAGLVPNGSGSCTPPNCLTVNKIAGTTNNKQAILILTGRALDGQARPPAPVTITDYLEGQNATPADSVFEHRAGGPTSINDRVVVVAP